MRVSELASHVLFAPAALVHALGFVNEMIEVWGARSESAFSTLAGDHDSASGALPDDTSTARLAAPVGQLLGQVARRTQSPCATAN